MPSKSIEDWLKEWADHPDVGEWPTDVEGWPQYQTPSEQEAGEP
jgi:hypothetical protein